MATMTSLQVAAGFHVRRVENGVFTIAGEYTLSATLSSADIIQMVKIPDGVTVLAIDVTITTDLMPEDTIATDLLFNVGDGNDSNRFSESHSANGLQHYGCGKIGDIADVANRVAALPFTYDLSDNDPDHFDTIDIEVIAFSGTGTGTGTIKLVAHCTADYP